LDWLDQRRYDDLDPRAERALRSAGLNFLHDTLAEACLAEAADLAPDHPAVLLAFYRYYLYKHRYPQAEAYARRCLAQVAKELGLPSVLLDTAASHADFTASEPRVRFWLYGMQALAYVVLRNGGEEEAKTILRKVVEVDPSDQTKTKIVLGFMENREVSD
jgi:tetratricopeptide (TPR) repeat protein